MNKREEQTRGVEVNNEDLRLRKILQRAVNREKAPASLRRKISQMIREK